MNNMMRKNNNRGGNKHRGGQRRYNSGGGGGGNRGQNDGQNLQRQKHHATQQLGKYNDLARNAQINGDRVDVEYYLQHVDHYTRVLTDIAAIEAERQAQHREAHGHQQAANETPMEGGENAAGDPAASGESEGEAASAADGSGEPQQPQQRQRQHRRPHHQHQNQEQSGNGAREANANREDIPLPGSILPPI